MWKLDRRLDAAMASPSWLERLLGAVSPWMALLSLAAVLSLLVGLIWAQATAKAPPPPAAAMAAPACAVTTAAQLADIGMAPKRSLRFAGVDYGYLRGHADCVLTRPRGKYRDLEFVVCQFSNPGALVLKTKTAEYAFAPGPSNPATVWFADGPPRCAADSNLNVPRRVLANHQADRTPTSAPAP